jgi:O-antigen ligase
MNLLSTHGRMPRLPAETSAATLLGGIAAILAAWLALQVGPAGLGVFAVLAAGLVLVREPPLLMALFMYIGIFKDLPALGELPVDPTVGSAGLLAAVCAHRFFSGRARAVPLGLLVPLIAIGLLMLWSLSWTPVPDYGGDKAAKFIGFTLIACLAPFFLLETERDIRRFAMWIVALAGLGALLALNGSVEGGRLDFGEEGTPILISRLVCSGTLVLLLLSGGWGRGRRLASIGFGLALIGVALELGSRGPLISLGLVLVCVLLATLARTPRQAVPILVLIAAGLALFPFLSLPETSYERLQGATADPVGTLEGDGRSALYREAVTLTREHPARGLGTGGFSLYAAVAANRGERYPHNIFLELSSELGIAAAGILALSLIGAFAGLLRRSWQGSSRARQLVLLIAALLLFNLFAAQFSGDINDNRPFWTLLGVAWFVIRYGLPQASRHTQDPVPVSR